MPTCFKNTENLLVVFKAQTQQCNHFLSFSKTAKIDFYSHITEKDVADNNFFDNNTLCNVFFQINL